MIEKHTIASKFYADEALDWAVLENKSFAAMREWADRGIPEIELHKYFITRAAKVLRG